MTMKPIPCAGRVLICGDRNWTDKELIKTRLAEVVGVKQVIEGEARGADTLARQAAEELGIPVIGFLAAWEEYGRPAGSIRNRKMLNESPDLVLAFHDDIRMSRGTKNMVEMAIQVGIPCIVVTH